MTGGEPTTPAGEATTVSWLRAVRIEFGLLARARRRFLLGALALMFVLLVIAWIPGGSPEARRPPHDFGGAFLATLFFTLLWSGEAWRDAPADARDWFWAQPIAQRAHELARVLASLGWLAIAAVTLIVLQLLVMLTYGQPLVFDHQTTFMWLNFVTGSLTFFLLGSIAGLRSAHPLAWVFGVLGALAFIPELFGTGDHAVLARAQRWVVWTLIGPYNGSTGVVPRDSHWGPLWLACALAALLAAAVAVVLTARVRRPS